MTINVSLQLCILVTLALPSELYASKILMLPVGHKSHVNLFSVAGKILQDRGHKVQVLTPDSMNSSVDLSPLNYHLPDFLNIDSIFEEVIASQGKMQIVEVFSRLVEGYNILCDNLNNDESFMASLENAHYDLVIIDGLDIGRCMYSIPFRLGVRYITFNARHDPWNAGVFVMPSVEHMMAFGTPLDADSTMWERVKSFAVYWTMWYKLPPSVLDETLLTRHNPTKPATTFLQVYQNSEMWLINLEPVCLDWPKMQGLHYQFIPGVGLQNPGPLPTDLEEFVQGSKRGVVVLSFGSAMKQIPSAMLEKMLHAFAQVEYRIVMRHESTGSEKVPDNVRMMSWLPQNDLLGHPKTKVFISHGGNNGQLEGLYHAVPMITFPLLGDQEYNAQRVAKKKFGVTLDKDTFTSDELVEAINDLAKPKPFRENIRKCAERFRSLSSPQDALGFWVEHIVQFGGDHLKPPSLKTPVWKVFMLDVLLLVLVVVIVLYTVLLWAICKLYIKCMGKHGADLPKKKKVPTATLR